MLIFEGQRFVGESNKARSDAGLERKGTLSANPQRGGLVTFSWIWINFHYKYFLAFLCQGCCCTFFSAGKRILSQLDGGGTNCFERIKMFLNHLKSFCMWSKLLNLMPNISSGAIHDVWSEGSGQAAEDHAMIYFLTSFLLSYPLYSPTSFLSFLRLIISPSFYLLFLCSVDFQTWNHFHFLVNSTFY